MSSIWLDFRHVLRGLRRSRTFTVVTILVLGVGIGANTAMFSLVRGVLVKPLPFNEPDRLVWLTESVPAMNFPVFPFNAPDVTDLASMSSTLEAVGSFQSREMELSGGDEARTVVATRASAGLFPLLGLRTALGRTFTEDEDRPRSGLAILSYRLWQERFGGSVDVVGRRIVLDRQPHTVVGVMARSAAFPLHRMPLHGAEADLFVPMGFTEPELANRGMMHNLGVIGRMRDGLDLEAVRQEMEAIGPRILASYPGASQSSELELFVVAQPLRDVVVGAAERPLLLLLGAMGLVMLVVCANVANLTLSRSLARRGEMALRAALGASRRRLVQIYLVESLLLALAGGLLGLAIAAGVLEVSRRTLHETLPLLDRVSIDPLVLLFVATLSLVVAFLFGWAPLFGGGLKARVIAGASGRGTVGRTEQGVLRGVAIVTMMLAVVLLVGAGPAAAQLQRAPRSRPRFQSRACAHALCCPSESGLSGARTSARLRR